MKKLLLVCLLLILAGCATVQKVNSGVNTIGERLSVDISGNWNSLEFPRIKPAQVWTMEGLPVDELIIYSGIKNDQVMHAEYAAGSKEKNYVFHSNMPAEEIVSMFEGVLSRDGSTFKLLKLERYHFAGTNGFRFEYERIRKVDSVQLRGVGFGGVDKGELFALLYHAPRLTFFPRHAGRVEKIAMSARLL